ncbi:hypothetical protein M0R45_020246 [Rubus argutus]|uniref:Uncharacterized protein n=1 Tax=Rubus argutus TaxID=59490 RepID=A0AAW1X9K1_RUBAR
MGSKSRNLQAKSYKWQSRRTPDPPEVTPPEPGSKNPKNSNNKMLTAMSAIVAGLGLDWDGLAELGSGFGIPCIVMVLALSIFLLGTRTYRYSVKGDEESPFARIGMVFVVSLRNWQTCSSAIASEEDSRGILPHQSSEQFKRFL